MVECVARKDGVAEKEKVGQSIYGDSYYFGRVMIDGEFLYCYKKVVW